MQDWQSMNSVTVQVILTGFFSRMVRDESPLAVHIAKGATILDVLAAMAGENEARLQHGLLDRKGNLNAEIVILVNHQFVSPDRLDSFRIENDCDIKIIPLASGG